MPVYVFTSPNQVMILYSGMSVVYAGNAIVASTA
jgi:hypothetical protein